MSYGKNQGQLADIAPFGGTYLQRAKTAARRPQFESSGHFYWKGNYRAPKHTPEMVRFLRGQYPQAITHDGETVVQETLPYLMVREHTSRHARSGKTINRTTLCSAGPLFRSIFTSAYKGEPCHCCPIWAEDVKVRQEKKRNNDNTKGPYRMGCSDQFVFSVLDYGLYFEVPDVDKDGNIRMNSKTNQPYTSWVKGNPHDPAMQGRPMKQGMVLPYLMGKSHWKSLINYDANVIGRMCKTCGNREGIVCVMKICGNPACGQFIYDPQATSLSDEQRERIDYYKYTCQYCGHTGYVDEVIECTTPGCDHPERTSMFDVDVMLQRMETGEGQQTNLQVLNFSEPRPIGLPNADEFKPLDLKKFKPTSLELQLKIHGLKGQPAQGTTVAGPAPVQPMPQPAPSAMAGIQAPMAPPPMTVPGMPQAVMGAPPMQSHGVLPPQAPQPQPLAAMPAVPYQVPQVPGQQSSDE